MLLVFIAGPFRGATTWETEQNVRRAEAVGLRAAQLGVMPIIPHTNTRFFNGVNGIDDEFWLLGYHELLRRCDAVLLGDGWERSTGARAEKELAETLGKPVLDGLADLRFWLREGRNAKGA